MIKKLSPKIRVLWFLPVIIFQTACAVPPEQIRANKVSPTKYQDYSCEKIRQELFLVDYKLFQLTMKQNAQVNNQNDFLGSPAFPLIFLFADNKNEEIAQLKGEYKALEYVAKQKECDMKVENEED